MPACCEHWTDRHARHGKEAWKGACMQPCKRTSPLNCHMQHQDYTLMQGQHRQPHSWPTCMSGSEAGKAFITLLSGPWGRAR